MSQKPSPFVSKIPELVFPPPFPGMRERLEATVMALDLLSLIRKCRAGQYNAEVLYRARYCLDFEIDALKKHRSNIVQA